MIPLWKISGRLGNQMFQFAFLYDYAKKNGIDFYYQDPKFFEDSAEELKALFRAGIPPKTDMVAIHVRRGDYVNNPFYVDLLAETTYYEDAMDQFPEAKFVVFSDDIEWCRQQSIFKDCEFSHGTEIEDMNNFASCTGHIIANSSFSYMAAWISPYTRKVVCPNYDKWYSDGSMTRTITPNDWIKL